MYQKARVNDLESSTRSNENSPNTPEKSKLKKLLGIAGAISLLIVIASIVIWKTTTTEPPVIETPVIETPVSESPVIESPVNEPQTPPQPPTKTDLFTGSWKEDQYKRENLGDYLYERGTFLLFFHYS